MRHTASTNYRAAAGLVLVALGLTACGADFAPGGLTRKQQARLALAAHYTQAFGMNTSTLAPFPPGYEDDVREMLARDWEIEGATPDERHAKAIERMDGLVEEGHRGYADFVAQAEAAIPDPEARQRGLLAWDFSRLVLLARSCYFVGYIDEATAWSYIDKAAQGVAGRFTTWREYGMGFLAVREIWAGEKDPDMIRAVNRLLDRKDLDWHRFTLAEATGP